MFGPATTVQNSNVMEPMRASSFPKNGHHLLLRKPLADSKDGNGSSGGHLSLVGRDGEGVPRRSLGLLCGADAAGRLRCSGSAYSKRDLGATARKLQMAPAVRQSQRSPLDQRVLGYLGAPPLQNRKGAQHNRRTSRLL